MPLCLKHCLKLAKAATASAHALSRGPAVGAHVELGQRVPRLHEEPRRDHRLAAGAQVRDEVRAQHFHVRPALVRGLQITIRQ